MMDAQRPKNAGRSTTSRLPHPRRRLDTMPRIRRELVALYHEARAGEIDPQDATRLGWFLREIGRLVEIETVEGRLRLLEDRIEGRDG
jgi:hypothetical protein